MSAIEERSVITVGSGGSLCLPSAICKMKREATKKTIIQYI